MEGCYTVQGAQAGALWQPRGVGGPFKREGTYVYLWLTHVDVWQKSTQHCKAIILRSKLSNFLKRDKDGSWNMDRNKWVNFKDIRDTINKNLLVMDFNEVWEKVRSQAGKPDTLPMAHSRVCKEDMASGQEPDRNFVMDLKQIGNRPGVFGINAANWQWFSSLASLWNIWGALKTINS